ncbi:Choline dehydrogenase [Bradyrhizobium sp. Rc2d]|uniref:alpha/beta fold hydrolase n=1 Tax=Bradyrhizobium sp. Rc2d TaxID=1855321 RepID=UPI00087E8B7D|nr:alpha/beta fold hydrolase [Bradyrhizobium sp. Rc2d]SDJ06172.1 Choline dehydrogenase [Bradyrhizobium sp. Rc2d]
MASRQTAWLSRGLTALVEDLSLLDEGGNRPDYDFDVVIVGSGYGAAVAADELALCEDESGKPVTVCILERGKEYLAGSFPSNHAELAGYARFAAAGGSRQRGVHDGLYDIRVSEDAVVVAASGLGGGSLINAGVMEMPVDEVFQEARWPRAIRNDAGRFAGFADEMRRRLGARPLPSPVIRGLTKTTELDRLAEGKGRPTHITVAATNGPNEAGVEMNACLLCGDCATGCNHNSKESLDLNLLVLAKRRGADVVTGATVLRVGPYAAGAPGWIVYVNHTEAHLRDRQPAAFEIRAKRVILAAGTLGSTEILLRSRAALPLSGQLGHKFSANGDMLVTAYDLSRPVNAVADESSPPDGAGASTLQGGRAIGPTITSMVDLRRGNPECDLVIQDLAVPGALRRFFEEVTTTFDVLNQLGTGDFGWHRSQALPDDAAVSPDAIRNSLILAMIGRDSASGQLTAGDEPICDNADGLLTVRWPELRMDRRFEDHHWRLAEMMKKAGGGGRMVNNPLWRPFSEELERLFGRQRGPLLTVHPLGGCAMGDNCRQGVTDHCGRVFDVDGPGDKSVHKGLVVLDGSIVPTSLGINPALTISVLALRAITQLKEEWKLKPRSSPKSSASPEARPIFASPTTITNPKPTLIELTEQLRGHGYFRTGMGRKHKCALQLTLTTAPAPVTNLVADRALGLRGFEIPPDRGNLVILKPGKEFDRVSDMTNPEDVALEARMQGRLRLFAYEPTNPILRTARAVLAWIVNRGLRDLVQWAIQSVLELLDLRPQIDRPTTRYLWYQRFGRFCEGILRVCSRAGAVRLIEYDFQIEKVLSARGFDPALFDQQLVRAVKRITYGRAASPFTQLLEMSLEKFPEMRTGLFGKAPVLQLNKRYLARQQSALLRVVDQQDGTTSLLDCFGLLLYLFRVTIQRHALSFRKPDAPPARTPERLPEKLAGLPEPEIDWLTVDHKGPTPVRIRLARYDGTKLVPIQQAPTRPVMLIHGYSASGTTFAHAAIPGNLTETLCKSGRDVWVLDLRCSAGLPTATCDWSFETIAGDIPAAIDHVATNGKLEAGQLPRVDIVAHCMGAAMFSMAILDEGARHDRLYQKIGRVVFSQVGPVMMLSRTNVLAAYIMRYARHFLAAKEYTFSPREPVSVAGQLLDRGLAAMSMPRREYKRENPFIPPLATPWAGTRNRMDALYGRTFSLRNVSKNVLDVIDDFFGPVSIETVSQVIHFASSNTIADAAGVNRYVNPRRLSERFKFPVMSIHGEENGLVDVASLDLMSDVLAQAGVPHLNREGSANPTPVKDMLLDLIWCAARLLDRLGIELPINRISIARNRRQVDSLIDHHAAAVGAGQPSYLTWRIERHGHQDCLIGKHAATVCGAIAKYLNVPDQSGVNPLSRRSKISARERMSSCQAVAPAYGIRVRVFRKVGKVRVQAADSSARGPVLRALIVPVEQRNSRFVFLGAKCGPTIPDGSKGLDEAGVRVCKPINTRRKLHQNNRPWLFEIPYGSWPTHASAALVLLLYDQAEGIGGNAHRPPAASVFGNLKSPVARAISESLAGNTIDDLRGGLISGSLEDNDAPADRVAFAFASCHYPNDILNHMPTAENASVGVADASLLRLSQLLGKQGSPSLLLMAGDQIYSDATAGLFDPKVKDERYRIPHERRGESRGSKAVMQRLDLDVHMMADDHEFQDNWAPNDPTISNEDFKRAKLAYCLYERASAGEQDRLWYKMSHKGLPFFLGDTRTERDPRTAQDWRVARIMGSRQFSRLRGWIASPRYRNIPKFVMTAAALLPRRLAMSQSEYGLSSDAWDGFPRSRNELLKFICDQEVKGLVFLSGDEHISSITMASVVCEDTGRRCVFHSIHSSGLFSPYAFANGSSNDFIECDSFAFDVDSSSRYRVEVKTSFFPGDGFALLSAKKDDSGWDLDVRFNREGRVGQERGANLRLI